MAKKNLITIALIGVGLFLLWVFFSKDPTAQKVNAQLSEALPDFQIPAMASPIFNLGVPAGGSGTTSLVPIPTKSSCDCKNDICGDDDLQVKTAPKWTSAMLSDAFGVSFSDNGAGINYGGMTPTQVFGLYI